MNDARVDTPTPGSSSVEAYEEDWYRSLRALAERRATEFDDVPEEPEEQAGDASPELMSGETPSAGTTDAPAGDRGSAAEPATPSPWTAPSLFDRPRPPVLAAETPPADPWAVPAPAVGETRAEENATDTAPGIKVSSTDVETPEMAPVADESPTFEARTDTTSDVEADADASGTDAQIGFDVPEPQQKTSPWARVLRPLERIQLSPLDRPSQHEEGSESAEAAAVSEDLELPAIEARTEVEDAAPAPVGSDAQVEHGEAAPEAHGADAAFGAEGSVADLLPPELPALDADDAEVAPAEEPSEAEIDNAGSADDVTIVAEPDAVELMPDEQPEDVSETETNVTTDETPVDEEVAVGEDNRLDESVEPALEVRPEPEAEPPAEPVDATATEPAAAVSELDAMPEAEITEPEAEAEINEPEAEITEPEAEITEPEADAEINEPEPEPELVA
ncbi:MAG: hypothetical protein ACXVPX_08330 [Actinomycetota bacterium]